MRRRVEMVSGALLIGHWVDSAQRNSVTPSFFELYTTILKPINFEHHLFRNKTLDKSRGMARQHHNRVWDRYVFFSFLLTGAGKPTANSQQL
jgi:hypothetical protein